VQRNGIFYQEKNEIDPCGNTPLMLAIKLDKIDCIKVLSDLHCCPKLRPFPNSPTALELGMALKNREILRCLIESNHKIKQHYLDLHREALFTSLEKLPNFKIDMLFSCKSQYIPFLKNITPSDNYKIYKKGSSIRLDMTLVGYKKFKCIRGDISVIFKGRGSGEDEGDIVLVDH